MYAGPENNPTCCPVTTATVPGWAKRLSESLSPFWASQRRDHRRAPVVRVLDLRRRPREGFRIVGIVLIELGNAVEMVCEIGEKAGGPRQVSVADTGGLHETC